MSLVPLDPKIKEKYAAKWKKIQVKTESTNELKSIELIKEGYKVNGLPEPTEFLFVESPLQGAIAWLDLNARLKLPTIERVQQLQKNKTYSEQKILEQRYTMNASQFDAYWFGYYDAIYTEKIDISKSELNINQIIPFVRLAEEVTCYWSSDKHIIMVRHPSRVDLDNQGRLHAEGKKALEFKDGTGKYRFHGMLLPLKYHKINSSQWKPEWFKDEKNAEVRAVLIKELGIERILKYLNARVIDKRMDYVLYSVALDNNTTDCKYLKMRNPSTGTIHIEGVHPNCKTVQESLNWRTFEDTNKEWNPITLT